MASKKNIKSGKIKDLPIVESVPETDDEKMKRVLKNLEMMKGRETGHSPISNNEVLPNNEDAVDKDEINKISPQNPLSADDEKMQRALKNLENMKMMEASRERGSSGIENPVIEKPSDGVQAPNRENTDLLDTSLSGSGKKDEKTETPSTEKNDQPPITNPQKPQKFSPSEEGEKKQRNSSRREKKFRLYPLYITKKMRVIADEKELANIRDFVSKHGFRMGMDRKQVSRCRLCVDEAFTNVFRHAYKDLFTLNDIDIPAFKRELTEAPKPGKKISLLIDGKNLNEFIIEKCGGSESLALISETDFVQNLNEVLEMKSICPDLKDQDIERCGKDMMELIQYVKTTIQNGTKTTASFIVKVVRVNRTILQNVYPQGLRKSKKISGKTKNFAQIEFYNGSKSVEIRVIDWGTNFSIDTEKISKPDYKHYIEIQKKGGLGLYMQRIGTDYFDMRHIGGRNQLVLRYNVPHPSFWSLIKDNMRLKEVSLPIRLGAALTVSILFVLGIFYWYSMNHQSKSLERQFTDNSAQMIKQLAVDVTPILIQGNKKPQLYMDLPRSIRALKRKDTFIISAFIVDRFGKIIGPDKGYPFLSAYEPPSESGTVFNREDGVRINHVKDTGVYSLSYSIHPSGQNDEVGAYDLLIGTIYMSISEEKMRTMLTSYQDVISFRLFLGGGALLGILLLLIMILLMMRPLRQLQAQIQRMSRVQDSESRLELIEGPSDIQELMDSLNDYAENLSRQTRSSKRNANEFSGQLADAERAKLEAEASAKQAAVEKKLADEQADSLQREMNAAKDIQEVLLPTSLPEIPGYQIDAKYIAMTDMGGDYFDFLRMKGDPSTIHLTVGDVAGHGLPSAMLMLYTKSQLKIHSNESYHAAEVLRKVHMGIKGDFPPNIYITMFYAILDTKNRSLNYACAGHNPMILFRGDTEQIYNLRPKGVPVGFDLPALTQPEKTGKGKKSSSSKKKKPLLEDQFSKIKEETIFLRKGDLVLLYTDGITEAMNRNREEFGEIRLMKAIKKWSDLSAKEFSWKLIRYIRQFTEGVPQSDDICFMVLKEESNISEMEYKKRIRLFEMIEKEKRSVSEACRELGIQPVQYKVLKKIRDKRGLRALHQNVESGKRNIEHLDVIQSSSLLDIICKHPEYNIDQMLKALNTEEYKFFRTERKVIHRELNKLNIANLQKRISFAKRQERRKMTHKSDLFLRSAFSNSDTLFNTDDIPEFDISDVIGNNDLVINKYYLENKLDESIVTDNPVDIPENNPVPQEEAPLSQSTPIEGDHPEVLSAESKEPSDAEEKPAEPSQETGSENITTPASGEHTEELQPSMENPNSQSDLVKEEQPVEPLSDPTRIEKNEHKDE